MASGGDKGFSLSKKNTKRSVYPKWSSQENYKVIYDL